MPALVTNSKKARLGTGDGSLLAGAAKVLAMWAAIGVPLWAVWTLLVRDSAIGWQFLLFLSAAALLSPAYGTVVYFGSLRRQQPKSARGALLATGLLMLAGLSFAGYIFWIVSAMRRLR
jgi:hypothetical protein